jgi:hypothetical protein
VFIKRSINPGGNEEEKTWNFNFSAKCTANNITKTLS